MSTQIQQGTGNKLRDPLLLKYIVEEVQKEGVVNEEDSIIVLAVKSALRLVKNAKGESGNLLISDRTGLGKDNITKKFCKVVIGKENALHRTDLSKKVLNYWQPKKEVNKKWTSESWDGKILYIEDPEPDILTSQAFKVMASGGSHITVVKDQKVLDREILGKPVMFVTSLLSELNNESLRRWDILTIDDSKETTKKVVKLKLMQDAGLYNVSMDTTFRVMLQKLDSYEVKIPFAMQLINSFNIERDETRTLVSKFSDYIKASAILHQQQRKKDNGILIAEPYDLEVATYVFKVLEMNFGMSQQEKEIMGAIIKAQGKENGDAVPFKRFIDDCNWAASTVYRKLDVLKEKGLVTTETRFNAGANKEIPYYNATDMSAVYKGSFNGNKDWKKLSKQLKLEKKLQARLKRDKRAGGN